MSNPLVFKDPDNWFNIVLNEVKTSYIIPNNISKDVCVDMGMNVGAFTVANHKHFNTIYAFEASYTTLLKAKKNIQSYHINNVQTYQLAGYSTDNATVKLKHFRSPDNHIDMSGNASVSDIPKYKDGTGYDETTYEEVKSISLDGIFKLIQHKKINYLKCDIECGEYDLLMNKDLSNIDFIAMELHCNLGYEKISSLLQHLEKYFHYYKSYKPHKIPNVQRDEYYHLTLHFINKSCTYAIYKQLYYRLVGKLKFIQSLCTSFKKN